MKPADSYTENDKTKYRLILGTSILVSIAFWLSLFQVIFFALKA